MSYEGLLEGQKLRELEELYAWLGDPVGTPTSTRSQESLDERLETLAKRELGGQNGPPLETYSVTTTTNGDVVRATPDYVRWFLRTYPRAGREDRARVSSFGAATEGAGGTLVI